MCQKPMVDALFADLGRRFGCPPCRSISLQKNDLSNLALTSLDLPDAPWGSASQSTLPCPCCPSTQLQEVVYSQAYPEPLFFCQRCSGIMISHEGLGRIRRFRLKLEIKDGYTEWMDPHGGFLSLVAFPLCIIGAWLCDILVFPALLLKGIDMQFHEFGHAFISWFSGMPAIPLAVVTIPFAIPKAVTYCLLALSLFFWSYKGRQEQLKGFTFFFYALLGLQAFMTFGLSNASATEYVVMGGVLGQFLIPLVLGMAYFYALPKFWNWSFMRYAFLFVALYCLEHNSEYWGEIVKGKLPFPYGSIVGGIGDTNGDMNRLIDEFGWAEGSLRRLFNMVGLLCRTTIWCHFLYLLYQKMKSSSADKRGR